MSEYLEIVTAATAEPVSLADAKRHIVIAADELENDVLLESYISAARAHVENWTGRALAAVTYRQTRTDFPCTVWRALREPVTSWGAFEYLDSDGVTWTAVSASLYFASTASGRIVRNETASWPTPYERVENVRVQYTAGPIGAIPAPLRQAILMLAADFYANREAGIVGLSVMQAPVAVQSLMGPFILR